VPTYTIGNLTFEAEDCVDGMPINPVLPEDFDQTPNGERPPSHEGWWDVPYVETLSVATWEKHFASLDGGRAEKALLAWKEEGLAKWLEGWPSGIRYDVRCLDGGAWDRSTSWGSFATLEQALICAKGDAPWGRKDLPPEVQRMLRGR